MKTRHGVLLALIGLLAWFAAPAQSEERPTGWALIVGVNTYQSGDITPLQYAEADAQGVARALIEAGGYPAEHVMVLTSGGKDKLLASRPNVVYWLSRFKDIVQPRDSFVFFFACHGISMEKESYILTSDTIAETVDNLEDSAFKVSRLQTALSQIPASRKLIAIDACRSDPRGGRGSGDNLLGEPLARGLSVQARTSPASDDPQVAATLFACKVGERSYEWPEKGHGFFSYYLINGLRGAAHNDQGVVTLPNLVDYVGTQVPAQLKLWKGGALQTPWAEVSGTGQGRWALASHPVAMASQPEPTPAASAAPVSAVRYSFRLTSPPDDGLQTCHGDAYDAAIDFIGLSDFLVKLHNKGSQRLTIQVAGTTLTDMGGASHPLSRFVPQDRAEDSSTQQVTVDAGATRGIVLVFDDHDKKDVPYLPSSATDIQQSVGKVCRLHLATDGAGLDFDFTLGTEPRLVYAGLATQPFPISYFTPGGLLGPVYKDLSASYRQGLVVTQEPPANSPAAQAGVAKNDILIAINGVPVTRAVDLLQRLNHDFKVGDEVKLTIVRNNQEMIKTMTIAGADQLKLK